MFENANIMIRDDKMGLGPPVRSVHRQKMAGWVGILGPPAHSVRPAKAKKIRELKT